MIFHRTTIKPNVINKVVTDNHELTQNLGNIQFFCKYICAHCFD